MYLRVFLIAALALVPLPLHASISFTNQAAAAGVASPGRSDGGAFGDYDGDGWPDLLVVPLDADAPTMLYHNQGDGRFVDQSQALASVGQAASGAFVDYDGDGDLDVGDTAFSPSAAGNLGQATGLALGDYDNDGDLDLFVVNGTAGFSQSSRTARFGLGTNTQIDSLVVRWPNGRVDRRLNLAINTSLRMVEGEGIIAVEETPAPLPHAFTLQQNYPNPFNAATVIEFNIATPGLVRLVLYNTLGQEIRTLIDEELTAGVRRVVWDGRDDQQTSVASGPIFIASRAAPRNRCVLCCCCATL